MSRPDNAFDARLDAWQDWQQAPWGKLRYLQAAANLNRHLGSEPLRVLDVGGGNAGDALPLARQGHSVTIVDSSAKMLADAQHLSTDHNLQERVALVQSSADEMDAQLMGETFDVVLCHNVIQYSHNPQRVIAQAVRHVGSAGLFSLIAVNRHSEPIQQATMNRDPVAALQSLDAHTALAATFDTHVSRFSADDVIPWLGDEGLHVVGHYGIRSVSDYIADNDLKHDPDFFGQLLSLELALADRMPYPQFARFFHLVAKFDPDTATRPMERRGPFTA